MDAPKTGRGVTQRRAPGEKYTTAEWIKGYAAWLIVFPIYVFLWAFALIFRRLPGPIHRKLLRSWRYHTQAAPDVLIPPTDETYMRRWWRIPRNAFFNIYFHHVLRSDDDTALHDHPWWNFSIVLDGGYYEHTIDAGGVHRKVFYPAGSVRFRWHGRFAHRLELATAYCGGVVGGPQDQAELPVKTIFITGPVLRRWGFHHPERWVDAYEWEAFCAARGLGSTMTGYAQQQTKRTA